MIHQFLKFPFLLLVACLLSSCLLMEPMPKGWEWNKRVLTGVKNFPSTDTEYGKGFKDGCYSAWDALAKGYLSDATKSTFDVKRAQKSDDYTTGWWDGMEQCTYIIDWDVT